MDDHASANSIQKLFNYQEVFVKEKHDASENLPTNIQTN